MCVLISVSVYLCEHVCVCWHQCVCTCVSMCVCWHHCVCTCVSICVYLCEHVCVCVCADISACVLVWAYVCVCASLFTLLPCLERRFSKMSVRFSTGRRVSHISFSFSFVCCYKSHSTCLQHRLPSRRWRCRWSDFPRWPSVCPLWRHSVPNANGSDLHLPGVVSKRHWQPPDGARRHQTGGCLWAAQGRSVQVHVLCHRVQRQHTESSGVLSGHGDQHAGQCTLPLAGQV